jgi:prepilin-type N-terminal cleavage/methylation domain-containing protein
MTRTRVRGRSAYTMIELLVVILVIGILVAITVPVLNKVIINARQTTARQEIAQLDAALQSFMSTYQVSYIPSRIRLCSLQSTYTTSPSPTAGLDADSQQYLIKLFPKLASGNWASGGVAWTSNSNYTGDVTLEGHQCLVFFLGGVQTGSGSGTSATNLGCLGFSTNPTNPASTTGDRVGPFFEFAGNRLVLFNGGTNGGTSIAGYNGNAFLSYVDPFGNTSSGAAAPGAKIQPYAYFSSYKTLNGYNRYTGDNGDNSSLGVAAYFTSTSPTTQFVKPSRFQILCAGVDGNYGSGGSWSPDGSGMSGYGLDDLSNFTPGRISNGE